MIERFTVNNNLVFKLDGQLTASRTAPIEQAQKWLGKQKSLIGDKENVIILGAGSGYHILEIIKINPNLKITVIDTDKALIKSVKEYHKLNNVEFLLFDDLENLKNYPVLLNSLKSGYCVLTFAIENRHTKSMFLFLKYFLLGRNTLGFNFISQLRGEKFLVNQPADENELLSVKNLHKNSYLNLTILKHLVK